MPIHSLNAIPPLVQVGLSVGISYLIRKLGFPPLDRNALIDTGASMTAITPDVVDALGPQRVGRRKFNRPGQRPTYRPTYMIRLCFEPDLGDVDWASNARWFDVEAVEAKIATPGVAVLIGQDLLAELVLNWHGPQGQLFLMY